MTPYDTIKRCFTKPIQVRRMEGPRMQPDIHWIQCASDPSCCPVFESDKKIEPLPLSVLVDEIEKA